MHGTLLFVCFFTWWLLIQCHHIFYFRISHGEIGKDRVDTGVKNQGAASCLSSEAEPKYPPRRKSITQSFSSNTDVSPLLSFLNLVPSDNVVEFPRDNTTTENGLVHETSAAKSEPSSTCPADVDVASASSIASSDSHQNLAVDEKSIISETTLFQSARKCNPVTSTTDTGESSTDDSDESSEDDASKKSLTVCFHLITK